MVCFEMKGLPAQASFLLQEALVKLYLNGPDTSCPQNCIFRGLAGVALPNATTVHISQVSIKSEVCITSEMIAESVLKEKYLQQGFSMRVIAKELSCSKNKIRNALIKYKIPIRAKNHPEKNYFRRYGKKKVKGQVVDYMRELNTLNAVKEMYSKEGLGPRAIARLLNNMKIPPKTQGKKWQHTTVRQMLMREGVSFAQ